MSPIKIGCDQVPPCHERPRGERHDWEMHPSWITGIEALEDYHRWVEEIVIPVAFAWIEEHKPEVYQHVPEELKDDVGVVMAAAFRLVKELPAYKEGLKKCEKYEAELKAGKLDSSKLNPVWTRITRKLRSLMQEAFAEHASHLGDKEK